METWKAIEVEDAWYKSIQFLGKGGSATTFLAMCSSPASRKGTLWAIKFYTNFGKPERIPSFLAAFKFLKTCDHPSIMRVENAGEWYHHPVIVAEYLPETLRKVIDGRETNLVDKVSYAMQMISALVYLKEKGVVHRDIKPQNIFIRGRTCVLGDFGMMKLISSADDDDRSIIEESTGPKMLVYYRTPDLVSYFKKESSISTASDVYQLGLVLAELFTNRNPMKLPTRDKNGNYNYASTINREKIGWIRGQFGERIKDLIEQMLEVNPDKRPPAADLIDWWDELFQGVVEAHLNIDERAFK